MTQDVRQNNDALLTADDFVLVKTKDGKMMYRRNGKYFSPEEMQQALSKSDDLPARALAAAGFEELKVDDGALAKKQQNSAHIKETIEQILRELKLTFPNDAKKQKFAQILESFLREIRAPKEFLYVLTAAETSGGFGINEEQAQKILDVSKRHLDVLFEKRKKIEIKPVLTVEPLSRAMEIPKAAAPPIPKKPIVAEIVKPVITTKKPLADVRFEPKLVGPAEELLNMDIVGLRRIGRDSKERLEELKERFDLLREDSLEKWMLGKKNWQHSPLYAMYLSAGKESLASGKPVKEVLNKEMTLEDFMVVLGLNKWLNY
ncbi:hypothetical protein HY932_00530 [Candidatus Falkowbacteria bacterium]|nr:hypothetical protein [Candidatus Falkowbacteria bacterium]